MPFDVPPQALYPERVPEPRRRALCADKWALMDRWDVPTERALSLIGRKSSSVREGFRLSDEQAEVLSCLLEIELTLVTLRRGGNCLHRRSSRPPMRGSSPIDAMGRCDPARTAKVLWALTRSMGWSRPAKQSPFTSVEGFVTGRQHLGRNLCVTLPDRGQADE